MVTIFRSLLSMDPERTLTCGQSFLWQQHPEGGWYRAYENEIDRLTVENGQVLLQSNHRNQTFTPLNIRNHEDPLVQSASKTVKNVQLIRDPLFPCLMTFLCSVNNNLPRITRMVHSLIERFGTVIEGTSMKRFPTSEQLATVDEKELRTMGFGYRAKFIELFLKKWVDAPLTSSELRSLPYEEARELLCTFPGVGPKVADCTLLYGVGRPEPIPIDTWIQKAVKEFYPDLPVNSYEETSAALRERWGPHAGHVQLAVFLHMREDKTGTHSY